MPAGATTGFRVVLASTEAVEVWQLLSKAPMEAVKKIAGRIFRIEIGKNFTFSVQRVDSELLPLFTTIKVASLLPCASKLTERYISRF